MAKYLIRSIRSEFFKRLATSVILISIVLSFLARKNTELLLLGITSALLIEWIWFMSNRMLSFQQLFLVFTGISYIIISIAGIFLFLRSFTYIHSTAFYLFSVIWSTDIGSYLTGSLIGGRKLAPRISPNKTWSGSFGGLVFPILIVFSMKTFSIVSFLPFFNFKNVIFLTILISVAAQIGDLAESCLKRYLNINEMSHLLPGHGGILDRLDSLLGIGFFSFIFFFLKSSCKVFFLAIYSLNLN